MTSGCSSVRTFRLRAPWILSMVAVAACPAALPPPPSTPAATPASQTVQLDLDAEYKRQFDVLLAEMSLRARQPPEAEVHNREALILPEDRDPVDVVLRRTTALLAAVRRLGTRQDMAPVEARLSDLARQATEIPPVPIPVAPTPPPRPDQPPAPRGPTTRLPSLDDVPSLIGDGDAPVNEPVPVAGPKKRGAPPPAAAATEGDGDAPREWVAGDLADLFRANPAPKSPAPQTPAPAVRTAPPSPPPPAPALSPREALFVEICRAQRQIAVANPLLDFERLIFLKCARRRPGHICDQYFGVSVGGVSGNGLFVLEQPFGVAPVVRNLLADAVVQNGRLAGTKLENGSFLSPTLSWDGRVLAFAYVECAGKGTVTLDSRKGIWHEQGAYHIFRVNVDGTDLRQLTDGNWNDIHPCWLPNGRLVFISERRGGYGRCHGRPVPTYTLHGMARDGTDIVPLSFHETNEWDPSVSHEGWIVYTRWDYVDRGDCIAHHPWITALDGRDARAIQGNYPLSRGARPDAEHHVRAIPGSHRYVATATPHHGQSFGSLILLDPDVEDDGAMAPLKRLTPDNGFPETQGGRLLYSTPWPLSEDFHLCVHGKFRKDGIYLTDAFGNQILLYGDAEVECLSPLPLRSRSAPPVYPHATAVGRPPRHGAPVAPTPRDAFAQVTVINVYNGLLPWPEDRKVTALRIVQLFPKATPSMDSPPISRWSESLARGVLGTVPVEEDGSAFFLCPPGKTLYFQALDADGLAVQSMQSDFYVHPGERLTCQGCHEPRHRTPPAVARIPLALRRPPSVIRPDIEDACPISFPRLVQPVLKRACAECHAKNPKAPSLAGIEQPGPDPEKARPHRGWTPAYAALSERGFGRSGKPPSRGEVRTVPGQFGAAASRLYQMLKAGHHELKLPPEDWHRLALWLDTNCNFYGAYFDTEAQAAGERILPDLE